jgi:BlaI family transcriptional regulator, penicillinase repressor
MLKILHFIFDRYEFLRHFPPVPYPQTEEDPLSRRERQIMDIVFRAGHATANEIHGEIPDAPSYSAVRALLAVLVNKGHLRHERDGKRYVYLPTSSPDKAGKSALKRILSTFFNNSPANLVASLLDPKEVDDLELARIRKMLEKDRT